MFRVDKESKYVLNITEGPLTYRYQFQEFYIHFGTDNNLGSEHKIQGYSFPAEVSIFVTIYFFRINSGLTIHNLSCDYISQAEKSWFKLCDVRCLIFLVKNMIKIRENYMYNLFNMFQNIYYLIKINYNLNKSTWKKSVSRQI